MKPKIYIANKGSHDYSSAEQYGELIFLTTGLLQPYGTNQMVKVFTEFIDKSSSEDYILMSGLPVATSILCSLFAKRHGKLNLLLFRNPGYIARELVL